MRKLKHSQNFINNQRLIRKLVEKAKINKNDVVIDLGAGTGNITRVLASKCKKVIAIEKDKQLFKSLRHNLSGYKNVKFVNTDIIQYTFPQKQAFKIFANIPFNYTADIIEKILNLSNLPTDSFLFMQKESAYTYLGQPVQTKESLKSLRVKVLFDLKIISRFYKKDFVPRPKVDIVLVNFKTKKQPLVDDYLDWRAFVTYVFTGTKGTVYKNIKKIIPFYDFRRLSKRLGFKMSAKVSDLTLEQWLGIYGYYKRITPHKKMQILDTYRLWQKTQNSLKKRHRTRIR